MNPIADIDVLGEVALLAVEFVQFAEGKICRLTV